ncbi:DUF2164 domain-containing protein [Pelosinus propionicus]|uniref:Uncharacterized conserved protein, DUF2164 family n=1 Tax=Pelosinus propionicus DSM 13327 TaxID=1123291 RepID=A0A1I4PS01_9FIRM|nr:DUF2164 domain-containing protein [Pelosinus propionicus]SFM30484.1 Uncharacterized conserved protein, DUF2164 family [Pelosinus propionicus DSM 13327]
MAVIHLSKELKKQAIDDLKKYFVENREEELGQLGAELLLDFMVEKVGVVIYNQAIKDAHAFMFEKVEDLYALEKKHRL